jgi:hypothetical protein
MSIVTGTTSKLPALHAYDTSQQRQGSIRRCSYKSPSTPITSVPFGKMSWMNIVLILHSLLFFLSSSMTSLVYFSTSDLMLSHGISVIILANCSLNFYIYCLSGRQFRTELKRIAKRYIRNFQKKIPLLCCKHYTKWQRTSLSSNSSTTTTKYACTSRTSISKNGTHSMIDYSVH